MSAVDIRHGDAIEQLRLIDDASIDAIITDPPYELGFMGKRWDNSGIAYSVELWAECLRVLKPGGHLAAFGGPRTYHRMACAVEDAGFEIRDSLTWMHGQGFPKGKAQLKPAHEPIVLARKAAPRPWLNIDATRVPGVPPSVPQPAFGVKAKGAGSLNYRAGEGRNGEMSQATQGRWPSNVLLSHSPSCEDVCEDVCAPGCPVAELDAQSGISKDGVAVNRNRAPGTMSSWMGTRASQTGADVSYGGSGGASRFFPTFRYQAKAPTRERPKVDGHAHPTVKPLALMAWLVRLLCPPGGLVLDPFAGSGTTLQAARDEGMRVIGIEREADYLPLIAARLERAS